MNNIPKIINVCWNYKDQLFNDKSPIILNGFKNLVDLNLDWNVIIHDDNDIVNYLKDNLSYNDYKLIEQCHIVEKSDLWRLIKIFNEGGMYIDLDRFYNIKLSDILEENVSCVLPMCMDNDFSQDIIISAPNNPIYKNVLQLILNRRKQGHSSTYFLGPQTYMHGVTEVICGEQINTNPGQEKINFIREKISTYPFIKTFRETPPYNTIVYTHNESKFNYGDSKFTTWEEIKREFYGKYNVKHWTNEW
jgi:hypothetical protein